mmetsp:Transcript_513/g.875  ORF Transcript_513/g.875 Transcript_513/m.875 type:complete len:308 (+) Transcript_513:1020-1943(+)
MGEDGHGAGVGRGGVTSGDADECFHGLYFASDKVRIFPALDQTQKTGKNAQPGPVQKSIGIGIVNILIVLVGQLLPSRRGGCIAHLSLRVHSPFADSGRPSRRREVSRLRCRGSFERNLYVFDRLAAVIDAALHRARVLRVLIVIVVALAAIDTALAITAVGCAGIVTSVARAAVIVVVAIAITPRSRPERTPPRVHRRRPIHRRSFQRVLIVRAQRSGGALRGRPQHHHPRRSRLVLEDGRIGLLLRNRHDLGQYVHHARRLDDHAACLGGLREVQEHRTASLSTFAHVVLDGLHHALQNTGRIDD